MTIFDRNDKKDYLELYEIKRKEYVEKYKVKS